MCHAQGNKTLNFEVWEKTLQGLESFKVICDVRGFTVPSSFMIPLQVIDVCRGAKPGIDVQRARFSALVLNDLRRAVNNLVPPNQRDAMAVDARQEIDLRIGASFTRFQTLLLQVGWRLCSG